MSNSLSLVAKVDAALLVSGELTDKSSLDELVTEIRAAMAESTEARKMLGPVIGKLNVAKDSIDASSINWIPVFQGQLAIGHRPKIKTIKSMRHLGATHVLTFLSES